MISLIIICSIINNFIRRVIIICSIINNFIRRAIITMAIIKFKVIDIAFIIIITYLDLASLNDALNFQDSFIKIQITWAFVNSTRVKFIKS